MMDNDRDRLNDAYFGRLGREFGDVTRGRVHAVCAMAKGTEILDVGCSGGVADWLLAREGRRVTAIDADAEAVAEARAFLQHTGADVTLIHADFLQYDFKLQTFDTVILAEVLEHALYPGAFVKKALVLLREGGALLATVPFGYHPHEDHKKTYYLLDFLELFLPHMPVEDYGILEGRYAFAKGVKKTGYNGMLIDLRDIIGKSEQAFLQKEKTAYRQQEVLREIKDLRAMLDRQERLKNALQRQGERRRATEEQFRQKEETLHNVQKELQQAKDKTERIVRSRRYRFAQMLAEIRKKPIKALALPARCLRWLLRAIKRRFIRMLRLEQRRLKNNFRVKGLFFPEVTMAGVLDEFTYACMKHVCRIVNVGRERFGKEIAKHRPDFLFVESAWNGNNGSWRYGLAGAPCAELKSLVGACREKGIKTVFWNKEDPVHFNDFLETARLFDIVLTTCAESVPAYKQALGHDRVYPFLFFAQPKVHNPVRDADARRQGYKNNVCFAGAYYGGKFDGRAAYFEMLADAALPYGLDIYDRMSGTREEKYRFPEKYRASIKKGVPYGEMTSLYKRYKLFLNVNSVPNSRTMFSRRVFELLASGVCVLSSPSPGVERLFDGAVGIANNAGEAQEYISKVLDDREFADRTRLAGLRRVLGAHTASHRFLELCGHAGIAVRGQAPKGVSVVVSTNRQEHMERVFQNFLAQDVEKKELIVVLNKNDMDMQAWQQKKRACGFEDVTILRQDESVALGECLNTGFKRARYGYLAKFDDDNYYAPRFLSDMLLYFDCVDADIVGKYSYYVYFEGSGTLALKYPGKEQLYVTLLSGSAMVMKREVFDRVQFDGSRDVGEDTAFLRQAVKKGSRLYGCDRFNYVAIRRADKNTHTWKIGDEEHMKLCEIVKKTDDYEGFVTV